MRSSVPIFTINRRFIFCFRFCYSRVHDKDGPTNRFYNSVNNLILSFYHERQHLSYKGDGLSNLQHCSWFSPVARKDHDDIFFQTLPPVISADALCIKNSLKRDRQKKGCRETFPILQSRVQILCPKSLKLNWTGQVNS